jgi:hypothetical protein
LRRFTWPPTSRPESVVPWYESSRPITFQRAGSPFDTKCWRATRSARSIASEPPLANMQRVMPAGSQLAWSRSTRRTRCSVAKGGTT